MATATQRTNFRLDLGLNDDETVFTDTEVNNIFTRAGAKYSNTDVKEAYEQTQPPHIQARKAYERSLCDIGGRKLLVTMEEPNGLHPEPLEFEISAGGISLVRASSSGAKVITSVLAPRAG